MRTTTPTPVRANWRWLRWPSPQWPGVLEIAPATKSKRPVVARYEVAELPVPAETIGRAFRLTKVGFFESYTVYLCGGHSSCDCANFIMGRTYAQIAEARPCKHILCLLAALGALETGDTYGEVGNDERDSAD